MVFQAIESALIKILESGISIGGPEAKDPQNQGLFLGMASHQYDQRRLEKVFLLPQDRIKHIYINGATGTGKTKLIEFLIQQDILAGHGFALADPHGDLTYAILCFLARTFHQDIRRLGERLILVEPFNRNWAIGFNPLASIDGHFPAVLELLEIFRRFWGNTYWGPRMDELLRNALVTLSQNNLTLLEVRPLLTSEPFRQRLTENVTLGEVRDYWLYRYNPLSDRMQAVYREAVLNKISAFLTDPSIYRILGQSENTINFRQAMDQGKWVLFNLSKGQLKENLRLLGALFLAKLKQTALSRVDIPENRRRPFFLYADEFQNFIGDEFEEIVSEARKYKFGLTIAHQNLDQLPKELRSVILGNVGTEIFFRLSHHDASQVSSEMDQRERQMIERKLIDLKVGEAYLKLKGQRPRLLKVPYVPTLKAEGGDIERIKMASFERWSTPVDDVEKGIEQRRQFWMNLENRATPRAGRARVRALNDDPGFAPDNSFEEGQNDW